MEIGNVPLESSLPVCSLLSEPGLEFCPGVFRELPAVVNAHYAVQHGLDRLERQDCIDYGSEWSSHCAHEIGAGEHHVAELRLLPAEIDPCLLNHVRNTHS